MPSQGDALRLSQARTLPPDVWALIGLHLKPRYLALLIRTSKQVKQAVDNDAYWTRVAFHAVWREDSLVDVRNRSEHLTDMIPLKENLYDLLGLDVGYYQAMELFIKRVDETLCFYASSDCQTEAWRAYYDKLKTMSLKEKIINHNFWGIIPEESQMTMKEMAKKYISKALSETDMSYNAFLIDLEDDPMPAKYKRQVIAKVGKVLEEVCYRHYRENQRFHDGVHFAYHIDKFGAP